MVKNNTEQTTALPVNRPAVAAGSIFIICFTFLIFLNGIEGEFLEWDDTWLIKTNPYIQGLTLKNLQTIFFDFSPESRTVLGAEYLPVRDVSWLIDHTLWGMEPAGFHLTNIFLHALNGVIFFILGVAVFRKWVPSLAAALLFAAHPVHVEAVTWLSARKEVLFTFFFLCSILTFWKSMKNHTFHRGWFLASLFLCLLSLLSKASAVTLPLIIVLLLFVLPGKRKHVRMAIPYFVMTVFFLLIFRWVGAERVIVSAPSDILTRVLTMIQVLGAYLADLVWPFHLSALYHVPLAASFLGVKVMLSAAVIMTLFLLSLKWHARSPVYLFSFLWFLLNLLPVLHIIPISILKADRYLYLPSAGFCLGFCFLLFSVLRRHRQDTFRKQHQWFIIVFLCVLLAFSYLTIRRNRIFASDLSLWLNAVEASPGHPKATFNLAKQYEKLSGKDPAYTETMFDAYRETLELDPAYLEARYNLALKLHEADRFQEAFEALVAMFQYWPEGIVSLSLSEWDPHSVVMKEDVLNLMGVIRMKQNDYEGSIEFFNQAMALDDRKPDILNNYAYALLRLGNYGEAERLLQRSLKMDPLSGPTYFLMGQMHLSRADYDEAERYYHLALEQNRDDYNACNSLGLIYLQVRKDYRRAISFFQRSLQTRPDQVRAGEISMMIATAEQYLSRETN